MPCTHLLLNQQHYFGFVVFWLIVYFAWIFFLLVDLQLVRTIILATRRIIFLPVCICRTVKGIFPLHSYVCEFHGTLLSILSQADPGTRRARTWTTRNRYEGDHTYLEHGHKETHPDCIEYTNNIQFRTV